jgi:hypothetical protein
MSAEKSAIRLQDMNLTSFVKNGSFMIVAMDSFLYPLEVMRTLVISQKVFLYCIYISLLGDI